MQLWRQKTINGSQRHNWNGQDDIFHDIAVRIRDDQRDGAGSELERQETEDRNIPGTKCAGLFCLIEKLRGPLNWIYRSSRDFCVPICLKASLVGDGINPPTMGSFPHTTPCVLLRTCEKCRSCPSLKGRSCGPFLLKVFPPLFVPLLLYVKMLMI